LRFDATFCLLTHLRGFESDNAMTSMLALARRGGKDEINKATGAQGSRCQELTIGRSMRLDVQLAASDGDDSQ
jgi:hypothetical protein